MHTALNHSSIVIASKARQSRVSLPSSGLPRHFVPRNDGWVEVCAIKTLIDLSPLFLCAASLLALVGCAPLASAKHMPIVKADAPALCDEMALARWSITLYFGHGIPGSSGADVYIPDAFEVAQKIVDDCKRGEAIYALATDGVSKLAIKNHNLSKPQIACIRAMERPGLFLSDKGTKE